MVDQELSSIGNNAGQQKLPTPRAVSPLADVQTWRQQLVRGALRALVVLGFLAVLASIYYSQEAGKTWQILLSVGAYAALVLVTVWRRAPYTLQAGTLLFLLYGLGLYNAVGYGLAADEGIFLLAFSALAWLFFGRRVGVPALALSILTLLVFGWAFSTGRLVIPPGDLAATNTSLVSWLSTALDFLMLAGLLSISQNHLFARLIDALTGSHRLMQELEAARVDLEERVEQRTQDLARRSSYLEATAAVAHEAAATLDMQELLSRVVTLISDRFGFYYTGIFLLDATGQWAELKAASGTAGQQALARGYRLHVEGTGVVSRVARQGEPHLASEAGTDAVPFDNPDLPDTRSEMALPLQARGKIIGVLNVQSAQPQAFRREDVAVLQTLADQVAMAISNAQLFQQAQESLAAERQVAAQLAQQTWQDLLRAQRALGVVRNKNGLAALAMADDVQRPEMEIARRTGQATLDESSGASLAVPVKVRDHVVGVIDARKPEGAWTQEEIALVETLTDQLGVALDSARLYQDTQLRAARERLIGEVAAHMHERLDVEAVLKTAAQEIGKRLGLNDIAIQLEVQGDKAS
jgi:GAF domain-containing protein